MAEQGGGFEGGRSLDRSLRHDFVPGLNGRLGPGAGGAVAEQGGGFLRDGDGARFVRGRRDGGPRSRRSRLRAFILLPPRVPLGRLVGKECALGFRSRGWRWQ